jgi:hypothetical protein
MLSKYLIGSILSSLQIPNYASLRYSRTIIELEGFIFSAKKLYKILRSYPIIQQLLKKRPALKFFMTIDVVSSDLTRCFSTTKNNLQLTLVKRKTLSNLCRFNARTAVYQLSYLHSGLKKVCHHYHPARGKKELFITFSKTHRKKISKQI